ncbi:MAG: alkaline phosphatase family protein [Candidatus Scalindua sp.]|nr:alkaline phosphatase family protein [Candidatus Scalindua sp.]MDV5166672.1 alkaline phosphatase family protein [Candidatus Scalindua sp.]
MQDFKRTIEHEAFATATPDLISQIMETYIPVQLPVLSGLARHYAVSDEWFCSVPSQTNANRAFSTSGTSRGLVTNNYYDAAYQEDSYRVYAGTQVLKGVSAVTKLTPVVGSNADELPITTRSLFEVLSTENVDWKVYWQSHWPPPALAAGRKVQYVRCMYPQLGSAAYNDNFVKIDDPDDKYNKLFSDARNGLLPAASWIEPKWGGGPLYNADSAEGSVNKVKQEALFKLRMVGTDMHPSCDTTVAEDFVHNLYTTLTESKKWDQTLFVITFNENGGTYDHLPPPGSKPRSKKPSDPPDDWIPSPSGLDRTPPPGAIGGSKDMMDEKTRTEFGFRFDQYGIRVPTLQISPFIKKNTIFRSQTNVPFDHTSLIASILDWKGIDRKRWFLGNRVAEAASFDSVFKSVDLNKRADNAYSSSITKSRKIGETLFLKNKYKLRYLGNPWKPDLNPAQYLGKPEWSSLSGGYYPTLTTNKDDGVLVELEIGNVNSSATTINNMENVRIVMCDPPERKTTGVTVSWSGLGI